MILLTAITSSGPRLAIKTAAGIVILEKAQKKKAKLPLTLEEALFVPRGLDRVRLFVRENLKDASKLSKLATPSTQITRGRPRIERSPSAKLPVGRRGRPTPSSPRGWGSLLTLRFLQRKSQAA